MQLGLGLMMMRTAWRMIVSYPQAVGALALGGQGIGATAQAAGLLPSGAEFWSALVLLVLPQLPLTLGNSVIATRDCALKYFGRAAERVTPRRLAMTIGLGNLAAGLVGGIPICHGAGGMTAHYRLGARTGWYGLIIGLPLLLAGAWAGNHTAAMLAAIPAIALGVPLAYVGVRHGLLAADALREPVSAITVISVGVISCATGNLLIGFAVGAASYAILRHAVSRAQRVRVAVNNG